MNALVTGANGFVGSILVELLVARGDRVRALVRDPRRSAAILSPEAEVYTGDLLDRASLARACAGMDVVFHTAALATHWSPREAYWRTNVEGLRHLLGAMEHAGAARLIHFSTYLVYGRRTGVRTEADPCRGTGDGYVDSKVAAEELVRREAGDRGIVWTILRPANIYGPRDRNWMPMVAGNIARRRMRLFGPAECPATVVYGDDVAAFAVECSRHPAARGEIFNVASPEAVTWTQFFEAFAVQLGTTFPSLRFPYRLIYPLAGALERVWHVAGAANPPPVTRFGVDLLASDWRCCVRKAQERIGFSAATAHERGLESTVRWLREEGLLA
jgi:nucleoside-diphosphate-sugar epimerase